MKRKLRVWAPDAEKVQAEAAGQRRPMQRGDGGWWTCECELEHGSEYRFVLDDGPPMPDPRSEWQPHGVHGPSAIVDHGGFAWSDARWNSPPLESAIIYELHVGTFTREGTFDGVIGRLDYLRDLGVTHIELMPVNQFAGSRGWGYDGAAIFAAQDSYGGPEGLKRLVNAAHVRGLGVIQDVVYNHFGPDGAYVAAFGPYLTDRFSTAWGKAVNFDTHNSDQVRRFFVDNALMWLRDYHIDGLRIDGVYAMIDLSAVHFLEELAHHVHVLESVTGRHYFLIGESDLNDPRIVRAVEAGGYGLDAQWCDDFHHALHSLLTGERQGYYMDFGLMEDLAAALQRAYVYDGRYSPFRQRLHGRSIGGLSGAQFVVCMQNHDQVGNRALGERIHHIASVELAKIGAAVLLASPCVPMLFMGEEWAASTPFQYFTSYEDEELGGSVRQGRRREFEAFFQNLEDVPDPQAQRTFDNSRLNWDELRQPPHREMLQWYRSLIHLRKTHAELACHNLHAVRVDFSEEGRWLVMHREKTAVAINLSPQPQVLPLREEAHMPRLRRGVAMAADGANAAAPEQEYRVLLASHEDVVISGGGVELPPRAVAIVSRVAE